MKYYDVVIIGAGVTGAWISYELGKRKCSVCVLEKESDICEGTSKANSAIVHAGYDPEPGSLMAKLNVRGNELIRERNKSLSIPFKEIGSLVVAFDEEGMRKVEELYAKGKFNGVEGLKILNREETLELEKSLNPDILGSLYAPSGGICSPFELTLAPMSVAIRNGVTLLRSTPLVSVEKEEGKFILNGEIETPLVINASGLYSSNVASLFGDSSFEIKPRKGEYSLLDKKSGSIVSHVIFQPPTSKGKGILVTPTVDGNLLVGPNAYDVDDKEDLDTTMRGQNEVFSGAKRSVPIINERDTITSFAGNRAVSNSKDFIIEFSTRVPNLLNVAGICSPGLTSAPAIAEYCVSLIEERGFKYEMKESYIDERKVIRLEEVTDDEKERLITINPSYGRVICRCETVTEGEIIDSIRSECGATTVDGVKRRIRAGMGRCQGGFCSPRVMEILSNELNLPFTSITKKGGKSWFTIERGGQND